MERFRQIVDEHYGIVKDLRAEGHPHTRCTCVCARARARVQHA